MTIKPELIDHIGLDLWQAAHNWRDELIARMADHGYDWFGGAPGMLTMHIGPNGIGQTQLQHRTQLSKQAVQQLIDKLEQDGVVTRTPHPTDKRAKWVQFTAHGLTALDKANRVKRAIERDYQGRLGKAEFEQLRQSLARLNARDLSHGQSD